MVLIITYQKFRKISTPESDQNHTLIDALNLLFPKHPESFERQLVHYLYSGLEFITPSDLPPHRWTPQHPGGALAWLSFLGKYIHYIIYPIRSVEEVIMSKIWFWQVISDVFQRNRIQHWFRIWLGAARLQAITFAPISTVWSH